MSKGELIPIDERRGWRAHLRRGVQELRRGDYRRATSAFESAHSEAPDEPEVLLALGRERMRSERYAEAEGLLRRALEANPDSAAAAAALARVIGLHLGRPEDAFRVVDTLLASDPTCAAMYVVRGEILLERGEYQAARSAFEHVETLVDDDSAREHVAARLGLARSFSAEGLELAECGEHERALFAFKRAADHDPQWSGPLVNQGVVFGMIGKRRKALEAYRSALMCEPTNPVALFNLGTTHHELGDYDEAIEVLEQLVAVCPEFHGARSALGNVLGESGRFDAAIAVLLEQVEIAPADATAWSSLGLAYLCSGAPDRGEQCLREALAADPEHFNAYYNLAVLLCSQQRFDEAEALLRQAHARYPEQTARVFEDDPSFADARTLGRFDFLD